MYYIRIYASYPNQVDIVTISHTINNIYMHVHASAHTHTHTRLHTLLKIENRNCDEQTNKDK